MTTENTNVNTNVKKLICLNIKENIIDSLKNNMPELHFIVGHYINEHDEYEMIIRWQQ